MKISHAFLGALLTLAFSASPVFAAGSNPSGSPASVHASVLCPSTYINARILAANTAETETAPTFAANPGHWIAIFSATCSNWYFNVTAAASVPSADVTDGGASFRAPTALRMRQGGTISVVADAACVLTILYLSDQPGGC
jgi:hypothetical protein